MKLEVGMYVRTNKVGIKKIYKIDNNKTKYKYLYKLKNQNDDGCIDLGVLCENNIIKASYNIIDLIEENDYINGLRVEKNKYGKLYTSYVYYGGDIGKQCEVYTTWLKDYKIKYIETIATKEQFENMEYRIGER